MLKIYTYIDRFKAWLLKEKEQPIKLTQEQVLLNKLNVILKKDWCQKIFYAENSCVKINVLYPNIYEYAKQISRINIQLQKNNPVVQQSVPSQTTQKYLTDFYVDEEANIRKDLIEINDYFYNVVREFLLLREKVIDGKSSQSATQIHFRNLSSTQTVKDNIEELSNSFTEIE
jgi:hypothetical protein